MGIARTLSSFGPRYRHAEDFTAEEIARGIFEKISADQVRGILRHAGRDG